MLKGLFSVDNPLMRFLSRVSDVLILNLLFIICSIPIFTIGASLTAMYYCLFKIKDEEEGYLLKKFFHSFKQNFKQATLMWLLMLVIGVLLFLEFLMYRNAAGTIGSVVRAIVLIGVIFWYLIGTYAFSLLSKFDNTIKNTFNNAVILLFANGPRTIAILVLTAAIIAFTLMQKDTVVVWNLILLWILFGFAGIGTINVQFLYPIFQKLIPEQEKEKTKSDYQFTVDEEADLSSLGYGPAEPKPEDTQDAAAADINKTAAEAPSDTSTAAAEAPSDTDTAAAATPADTGTAAAATADASAAAEAPAATDAAAADNTASVPAGE